MTLEETAVRLLKEKEYTVSTAESCTGGLLAGRIINVSGASDVINVGFITYANEAKMKYLGVSSETLKDHGAVSRECAKEMALGVTKQMNADVGLATTGIAGPDGGTVEKPVGLVYIGCNVCGNVKIEELRLSGTREEIRNMSVTKALELLVACLKQGDALPLSQEND